MTAAAMSPPHAHRLAAPLETAAQRVKHALRQAVERSIEGLGLAALAAGSVAQRSDLLEAQFELNRKSAIFILAFDEAFEERLRNDTAPKRSFLESTADWTELTLMDDHEVENKVAAERFGLQMAHSCEWELRELQAYLTPITGGGEPDKNPLRPELLSLAMMRAAERVSERAEVRRLLMIELGRSLADVMAPLYRGIVADWRAAGLKPAGLTVRQAEARASAAANSRSGVDSGFGNSGPGSLGGASRSGYDDFRSSSGRPSLAEPTSLSRLAQGTQGGGGISHGGGGSGGGAATPGPGRGLAGAGLMGSVDPAMMGLIRRLAFVDVNSFAATESPGLGATPEFAGTMAMPVMAPNLIHAHREELRAASRGQLDHMVIDLIGTLFDQILSDPKVPPQMARQLARLQLPVLRAALGDATFFSSRRHPVRRFVNRLASVSASFEDLSDEQGQAFLAKVRELVQGIVEGDFEHIATYETQLHALESFVAEQSRREVDAAGSGVATLLQAKEDELRLHRLYALQLQGELQGVDGPAFLREFLSDVWSRVMLRAAADPAQRERLKELRKTALDLFMSVQPKTSRSQRDAFLAELPKLMQALNAGLNLIAWPDQPRREFFAQLLPAHAEALKQIGRPLDYNLLAKRVETTLEKPVPSRADLAAAPLAELPTLTDAVLEAPFAPVEARQVGLVSAAAVDWTQAVDIEVGAEPEITAADTQIDGLPTVPGAPVDSDGAPTAEPLEPTRGRSLADHVQIGFAYQMLRDEKWFKVRLSHVSAARTFFVFTHGGRHKQTISLTYRMLARLCETGRLRAFEQAYLIERATARARQQLSAIAVKAGVSAGGRVSGAGPLVAPRPR